MDQHAVAAILDAPGHAERVDVTAVSGESYEAVVRGHRIVVDQPADAGGDDSAPTPVELFVASLATCVAYYAGRYLTQPGRVTRPSEDTHGGIFRRGSLVPDRRADRPSSATHRARPEGQRTPQRQPVAGGEETRPGCQ